MPDAMRPQIVGVSARRETGAGDYGDGARRPRAGAWGRIAEVPDAAPAAARRKAGIAADALCPVPAGDDLLEAPRSVDHVTLLPNRHAFMRRFPSGGAPSKPGALVLVTLADAKQFNDLLRALGHAYADDFVRTGAAQIAALAAPETPIYHVSVLSFALAIEAAPTGSPPPLIGELIRRFSSPLICQDIPITTRIGVGLTDFVPGESDPAEALRAALAAAQDSRRREAGWALYDRRSDNAHRRAFRLLADLRTALASDGQLRLVYQPRVAFGGGRVEAAEALLRWDHPQLGPIAPGEFIALAETTALIGPLTRWVLRAAARQARAWREQGLELRLGVNVAPANLRETDFIDNLTATADRNRMPASCWEIEITEGTATSGETAVIRQLELIRQLGISIAIDDFGTGYSNLGYLTELPANVLKIDQSLVRPLDEDPRRRLLVRSVIELAHGLGYSVVAEGIESATIYRLLAEWGCDEGQGYWMSRPLGAEGLASWIDGWQAPPFRPERFCPSGPAPPP